MKAERRKRPCRCHDTPEILDLRSRDPGIRLAESLFSQAGLPQQSFSLKPERLGLIQEGQGNARYAGELHAGRITLRETADGGPAGSFFSFFLLEMALRVGREIHVDVYEPRHFKRIRAS
jgi:hypothetical protein